MCTVSLSQRHLDKPEPEHFENKLQAFPIKSISLLSKLQVVSLEAMTSEAGTASVDMVDRAGSTLLSTSGGTTSTGAAPRGERGDGSEVPSRLSDKEFRHITEAVVAAMHSPTEAPPGSHSGKNLGRHTHHHTTGSILHAPQLGIQASSSLHLVWVAT